MPSQRLAMELMLKRQRPDGSFSCRTVSPDDREDLAILLYAAFHGTVDDEGETFADALAEADKTFSGAYGRLLPECSFVIEEGEFLASACLVSWFDHHNAPLVVFSMTRPECQRRGMAGFLLQQSINALLNQGFDRLTLIVTRGNSPAEALYRKLGFVGMAV